MIYYNDILPLLETKRVSLSSYNNSKVKIDFQLRTREGQRNLSWVNDEVLMPFIRVHFFILDDSTSRYLSSVVNPQLRYQSLQELTMVAPNKSTLLTDVLQYRHISSTPDPMSGDYVHDVYHEIEFDIPNFQETQNENIHLVSFLHLDVENYMQEHNLTRLPEDDNDDIAAIGGSLVYDLLLTRMGGTLSIPLFRDIYYAETAVQVESASGTSVRNSVEPYSGPVHYHDANSPGPNGYTGWMGGLSGHSMGPELKQRSIRNYKVVSDTYFLENSDSIFSLESSQQQPLSLSDNLSAQFLGSIENPQDIESLSDNLARLIENSDFLESQGQRSIVDHGSRGTSHINVVYDPSDPTGIPLQKSHYGCVVGIDFLQILKSNSYFGNIIKFHHQKGNNNFVNDILYKSQIQKVKILRQRVTNEPKAFNDQCTLKYAQFDRDEPDKLLVEAKDRQSVSFIDPVPSSFLKNRLIAGETADASIEEVDLLNVATLPDGTPTYESQPEFFRSFVVRDYDLFHNVNFGKYTYIFELSLTDGIQEFISELIHLLKRATRAFNNYYCEAIIPVLKDNGLYATGNYDFDFNEFHESFKERDFSSSINTAVSTYSKIVHFLTGNKPLESDVEGIKNSISPRATTITTLEGFREVLFGLETALTNLIFNQTKFQSANESYSTSTYKKNNVSNSSALPNNIVYTEANTGIIVDSFSDTTLMADFSVRAVHDANESIPNLVRLFYDDLEIQDIASPTIRLPRRFITVTPASYRVAQYDPVLIDPLAERNSLPLGQSMISTPDASNVKLRNRITAQMGGLTEISNINTYNNSNPNARMALDTKISAVRLLDSKTTGIVNKGDVFFPAAIQHFAGGIQFGPANSFGGFAPDVSLLDPNSLTSDNRPNISSALRKAICDAAYKGDNRDTALSQIESAFGDLVLTRRELGQIYDNMLSIIGLANNSIVNRAALTFEDRYLGTTGQDIAQNTLQENSYEKEKSRLVVMGPKQQNINVSVGGFSGAGRLSTRQEKKYVFAKFQPQKEQDNVISVNNGYLLEV
jgi:hypothetical protein